MQHIFWLIEDRLCGRAGPNYQPWRAQELKQAGVGALLSVNNGDSVYADDFEAFGMSCRCIPLCPAINHFPTDQIEYDCLEGKMKLVGQPFGVSPPDVEDCSFKIERCFTV